MATRDSASFHPAMLPDIRKQAANRRALYVAGFVVVRRRAVEFRAE